MLGACCSLAVSLVQAVTTQAFAALATTAFVESCGLISGVTPMLALGTC